MPITAGLEQITANTASQTADATSIKEIVGKDDFLRLFVTQLANQDPMEPMKDQEFIAQMAQFSSLEQLQNMNENLTQSLQWSLMLSQTINNTMATSLIGRTVQVGSAGVSLGESGDANIHFDLEAGASDVVIEVSDRDGNLVRVLRMAGANAGSNELSWDGRDTQGNRAEAGTYNLTIRAEDSNGAPVNARGFFTGVVDGVRYVDGAAMLTVDDVLIPLSDVIEIHVTEEDGAGG